MIARARDNPFRSERVLEVRYLSINWTWSELLARLAILNYRGAIIGPHGAGKTTLLEDLIVRLEAIGFQTRFARLDQESPRLSPDAMSALVAGLGPRDIILLDGCEQLSFRAWRQFLSRTRSARGLIITTHEPGRLQTLVECRTNAGLLEEIVRSLIDPRYASSLDFPELFQRHAGNIRDCLRELYDAHPPGQTDEILPFFQI